MSKLSKMMAVCREVNTATGDIAVYSLDMEINSGHQIECLRARSRANPELRYFIVLVLSWERSQEKIINMLSKRDLRSEDLRRFGGIVEL